MSRSDLLTIDEAVREGYGCASTLRQKIKSGELNAVHNGRLIFVRREDLDGLYKPVSAPKRDGLSMLKEMISEQGPLLTDEEKADLVLLIYSYRRG